MPRVRSPAGSQRADPGILSQRGLPLCKVLGGSIQSSHTLPLDVGWEAKIRWGGNKTKSRPRLGGGGWRERNSRLAFIQRSRWVGKWVPTRPRAGLSPRQETPSCFGFAGPAGPGRGVQPGKAGCSPGEGKRAHVETGVRFSAGVKLWLEPPLQARGTA